MVANAALPLCCTAPSCQGDTGVALLTSGKGELFAVNITNPEQVTMAHYVHDQTVSLAGGTQPQCGARGSMVHTALRGGPRRSGLMAWLTTRLPASPSCRRRTTA